MSIQELKDGEPCSPGCANHVTHPCECCERIQAQGNSMTQQEIVKLIENTKDREITE